MALGQHRRAVGVFSNRRDAEIALRELKDAHFPMDRISVISRDADRQGNIAGADVRDDVRDRTDTLADEGAKTGALAGGAFGGLTGLLVGLGTLALPGIGPIMLAGATATAIATTLAGSAIGALTGTLLGGLVGAGIPEEDARGYSDRVSRGDYLIMVEGTDEEINRAQAILSHRGIEDWRTYDIPDAERTRTNYAATSPRSALVHNKRAVGVFSHRRDAEAALGELRDAGFNMHQISLVGRDGSGQGGVAGANLTDRTQTDQGAKTGAATGGVLGGLGGLLVGLGALAIPGIGPIIAGGALGTALATAAAGGAIGAAAGGVTGALVGLGIPDDRARFYNDRVTHGDYLVMVDGTEEEVRRAEAILRRRGIREWEIFDVADGDRSRTSNATPRQTSGRSHRAVGVFPHRRDAEVALRELRETGFNMNHVSVVGKDAGSNDRIGGVEVSDTATGNKADEGAKAGAATGGALGGLTGLLVGLGALAIPGIGPVMAGGTLATALATTVAGGAIGAATGGLTGALVGLGIPEERARFYNDRVSRGDYLVMVDGTEDEIRTAQAILSRRGIQDWGIYDTSDVSAERKGETSRDSDRRDRVNYATAATTPGTTTGGYHRAIGVFPHRRDAEAALGELRNAGFDMNQISLVGRDANGEGRTGAGDLTDRTQTDEGAKGGAAIGGAAGGLGGLLVGLGALAIPGIGPVVAGGALATALATAAAGGAIGAAAGGVTGALVGLGIPDDRARLYNDRVSRGDYLVMVDGTEDEIRRAESILSRRGIQDWGIFDAADGGRSRTGHATRNVIDSDRTPGVTPTNANAKYNVLDTDPEVIIIDRRDQT